jgi:uncharacterized membrane protein YfcA
MVSISERSSDKNGSTDDHNAVRRTAQIANSSDNAHASSVDKQAGGQGDKLTPCRKHGILVPMIFASCLLGALIFAYASWTASSNGPSATGAIKIRRLVQRSLSSHHHKPLHPLDDTDYTGFLFASLGLMLAAGGGIGGGGVLVPIYILVMGFSPKHAIPLSNVTVLGGAIANTALNWNKRHPDANRPLIDWDLILVMEPLTIAGALMGAFLNKLLPETVLTVMLVILLSVTSYTSLTKAVKMYKKESRIIRERGGGSAGESELTRAAQSLDNEDDEKAEDGLIEHMEETAENDDDLEGDDLEGETLKHSDNMSPDLQRIMQEESYIPLGNITVLVLMFIVVLVANVLKGGGAFPSPLGIECGSTSFWMANILMLAWIAIVAFFCRAYLIHRYHEKIRTQFKYIDGDISWDERATIVYPLICALAGFFAGMFGIGGGIVKGPLMLAMGVHPKVSSASSACMILFTSFTATTSFIVFGLLLEDYAGICCIMGFVTTLVGQIGLTYLMKKNDRNSYIAFSIGFVVLLSAFLMTVQSLISIAEGGGGAPGGICGSSSASVH